MNRLDPLSIAKGAAVAAAIGLSFGVAGRSLPSDSSLVFLFALVIFGGMALGGFIAGREHPDIALTAGGVAAGIASIALQVINVIVAAVRGTLGASSFVTATFTVLLCTSMGFIGGYVAFRRAVGSES